MSKPKLVYFKNIKGRAEPIKYILAQADVSYDLENILMEDWPKRKADTPMGQLPYFEDQGVRFCQTAAIARYVAEKYGLVPSSLTGKALCDQFVAHILQDVFDKFKPAYVTRVLKGNKEAAAKEYETFKNDALPGFLKLYEETLAKNGSGFLVGDKLTWADLVAAEQFQRLLTYDKTALDGHPKVKSFVERVHQLPNIKRHVDTADYE